MKRIIELPSYSILMSLYNLESVENLSDCLESLYIQTHKSNQVILVFDGHIDIKLEQVVIDYLHKLPIEVVRLASNVGLGEALNAGLTIAKNQLVARMDSDDICHPRRFEIQVKYLLDNPLIDVLGSSIEEFSTGSQKLTYRIPPKNHTEIVKRARFRNPMNHMTIMFKKSSVESVGGYRNLVKAQDYDLWVRMILKGYKFANLQDNLVRVRVDRLSAKRGGNKYFQVERQIIRSFYETGFINRIELCINIAMRFLIRFSPQGARSIIYYYCLRRKSNSSPQNISFN